MQHKKRIPKSSGIWTQLPKHGISEEKMLCETSKKEEKKL